MYTVHKCRIGMKKKTIYCMYNIESNVAVDIKDINNTHHRKKKEKQGNQPRDILIPSRKFKKMKMHLKYLKQQI